MKLNLGCGRDIRPGWVNVDSFPGEGVDLVLDLDDDPVLPFGDNTVDLVEGSHVIEHLHRPLPLMQELWRVAKPGADAVFRAPYGSSDDADTDPTHVRRMFVGSWAYFGQPAYWRADYGYRGDWKLSQVVLHIDPDLDSLPDAEVQAMVHFQRNVVREMVAHLRAVKPARLPRRELLEPPTVIRRPAGV